MGLKVTCVLCGKPFELHERSEALLENMNAMLAARGEAPLAPGEIACCSDVCFRDWRQMKEEEKADRVAAARRELEEMGIIQMEPEAEPCT